MGFLYAASWPLTAMATDATPQPAAGVRKLSLPELYQLGESRHPTLRASREAISAARYTHDEQKWLALPSGDMNAYLTWSPDLKCRDANDPREVARDPSLVNPKLSDGSFLYGGSSRCVATNANLSLFDPDLSVYAPHGVLFRFNLNITVPLFTFGKLSIARDLGKVGVTLAQAQADATRADFAVNLVRAYFGIKAARAALDTIREGKEQINKWIKTIDKELDAGKSSYTEIDLMRMKVAESQVEIGLVDVERTQQSALAALRYLAQDENVDVDESDLSAWQAEEHALSYYLESAFAHRPEMRMLDATGRGAQLYKRLRIAEFLPDFGLIMNFGYGVATSVIDPDNAFMNRFNYLGAGLGLGMRMNLDFGPKAARLQKSMADVRQYEQKRQEALSGGALEIERAYNDFVEARRRLAAAEMAEKRARGWLQGIKQAIDVGTAESRDMLDALRAYFDQHLTVLRSVNDLNVQAAVLRRLSGLEVIPK